MNLDDLIEGANYKESNIYKVEIGRQIGRIMELRSMDIQNDETSKNKYENAVNGFELLLTPITDLKLYDEGTDYNDTRRKIIESESEHKFEHLFNLCMNNLSDTGIIPAKTMKDADYGDTELFREFVKTWKQKQSQK